MHDEDNSTELVTGENHLFVRSSVKDIFVSQQVQEINQPGPASSFEQARSSHLTDWRFNLPESYREPTLEDDEEALARIEQQLQANIARQKAAKAQRDQNESLAAIIGVMLLSLLVLLAFK